MGGLEICGARRRRLSSSHHKHAVLLAVGSGDDVMNEFTNERIRVLGGLGAVGRVQVRVLVDVVGLTVD